MPRPVTAIRNLGPAMAAAFARAGLETAEAIETLGADAAYARLIASGHRPHFMAYVALVLGLMDRPWADLAAAEKPALRARFDAIKAGEGPAGDADGLPAPLAAELRRLGLAD
ncbi:MAG: TfoX/Sxy family DNA transformation protein [Pseudomonadota bacterium]